ncbi:MAG: hypothetical protein ACTHMS_02445 [Jatrophihabitans sp.]|uniref:hypothetical protein n=1 Tax=Jatrophihabitans sp. TaxID=1932789 RepID=UPI003F7E43DE
MSTSVGGAPAPPRRGFVLGVLLGSVVVMMAYWTLWCTDRAAVASNHRAAYVEFEDAFPAADAWLTWCLLAAWWTLRRSRPAAVLWLLAGGGGGVYLFGMDVLYDLEHGIWWRSGAGGVIELGINLLTLAVSVGLLAWTWRHRDALLGRVRPSPSQRP